MALAATDVAFTIPLSAYAVYNQGISILHAWDYDWVHTGFDMVYTFPTVLWQSNTTVYLSWEMYRWIFVLGAFLFFGFFGFGEEARLHYGIAISSTSQTFKFYWPWSTDTGHCEPEALSISRASMPVIDIANSAGRTEFFLSFNSDAHIGNNVATKKGSFDIDAALKV